MGRKINSSQMTYYIFSIPSIILWLLFLCLPLILGFYYSMTDWNGISTQYNFVGLDNFARILSDSRVRNSLMVTGVYTILETGIITCLAIIFALILNCTFLKCRTLIRAVFFFPAVLSMITVGLIFSQIMSRPLPAIGEALGIRWLSSNLLASQSTALLGIVIIHVWHGTAVPTVMYMAGLQSVPSELLEAARIDGAGPWQRFIYIIFPFLVPVMKVGLLLLVKAGITQFDYIRVTTGGGPGHATETISTLIMEQAFGTSMKYGYAITEALLLFIILIVVTIIQQLILGRKEVGQQ